MKPYNKNSQRKQLEKLSALTTKQKEQIAKDEEISLNTLYNYIRGSISVPALAEAIIVRANLIQQENVLANGTK